jgi:hypothetical protein
VTQSLAQWQLPGRKHRIAGELSVPDEFVQMLLTAYDVNGHKLFGASSSESEAMSESSSSTFLRRNSSEESYLARRSRRSAARGSELSDSEDPKSSESGEDQGGSGGGLAQLNKTPSGARRRATFADNLVMQMQSANLDDEVGQVLRLVQAVCDGMSRLQEIRGLCHNERKS